LLEDQSLLKGLNTFDGKITCKPVANCLGLEYHNPEELLTK
jgi:alanine dehydrogenase